MNEEDFSDEETKSDQGFDLGAPSSRLPESEGRAANVRKPGKHLPSEPAGDPRLTAEGRPASEWRGFEEEEDVQPEVAFSRKGVVMEEMDMTPMVDVTFLLLIFFMVSASFTTQRSISQPPLPTDEPSENVRPNEIDLTQYVEIIIDQYNSYRLTSKDSEEIEAPSDQEMRVRLRDMVRATDARRVVIKAHANCWHEKVITAQDAAMDNEVEEVSVQLTEEDY